MNPLVQSMVTILLAMVGVSRLLAIPNVTITNHITDIKSHDLINNQSSVTSGVSSSAYPTNPMSQMYQNRTNSSNQMAQPPQMRNMHLKTALLNQKCNINADCVGPEPMFCDPSLDYRCAPFFGTNVTSKSDDSFVPAKGMVLIGRHAWLAVFILIIILCCMPCILVMFCFRQ